MTEEKETTKFQAVIAGIIFGLVFGFFLIGVVSTVIHFVEKYEEKVNQRYIESQRVERLEYKLNVIEEEFLQLYLDYYFPSK